MKNEPQILTGDRNKLLLSEVIVLLFMVMATVGRIDLANEQLNFILSPALVLGSVVCLLFAVSAVVRPTFSLPIKDYMIITTMLLAWSAFTLYDMSHLIQLRRLVLFIVVVVASLGCYRVLYDSKHRLRLIKIYIRWSFIVYCLFSAVQVALFVYHQITWIYDEPIPYFKLLHQMYGASIIRINGGFLDANLAGYFLITLYLLIRRYRLFLPLIIPILLLILFTLSRSSIVVMLVILILEFLSGVLIGDKKKIKSRTIVLTLTVLVIFSILLIYIGLNTNYFEIMWEALKARFQDKDGSGSLHVKLINLAYSIFLSSTGNIIHGLGFASSSYYAELLFSGSKYANFHSDFITIVFEIGVIGLFIYLLFYILPLVNSFTRPLKDVRYGLLILLSLVAENIFYQQYLLYHYWITIVLVWLMVRSDIVADQTYIDE